MLSTLRIESSPFNEQQLKLLQSSIGTLDPSQSLWLSGYLAGRLAGPSQADSASQAKSAESFTIIYATETGNSEGLASTLAKNIEQQGLTAELHSMANFRPANLRKLKNVTFIISTHGEGDPPDEAIDLFEYLHNERAPQLTELNYRVLALGDRSYSLFCEAGRKLDERLKELGAKPFGQRVDCDVDYANDARKFSDDIIHFAQEQLTNGSQNQKNDSAGAAHLSLVPNESRWSRENPYHAEVGQIQRITGSASIKDVYHIELSLDDAGLQYQPGDALGVWASNDPTIVNRILEALLLEAETQVSHKDQQISIKEMLTDHLEITRLTTENILAYSTDGGQKELETLFTQLDQEQQRAFMEQRQLVDLVDEYPAQFEAQALVDILRPIAPRSYSIASSQKMVDEEVHLTVATLHSNAIGTTRQGLASGLLNQRLKTGQKLKVFPEPNTRIRLPEASDTPIIMIAAGTGIAPFRAFMQEQEQSGNQRDSWLIFGNPHLHSDFLYQREWLHWRKSGLLRHIDVAWSRDQAEKRYVQNVVLEQAERLDEWLQRGAYIYLCGSLKMGQAVQLALHSALAQQRGLDSDAAFALLAGLRREKRIKKDLY